MDCSFCKELETTKFENKKLRTELIRYGMNIKIHYKVALVEVHERFQWGLESRESFVHEAKGFYYCPLCGRRLKDGAQI